MPDYEQFIADAHSLARDSSYLNNRAKERLLNASNAIRYALSNDCDLQSHMYSRSPEDHSIPLGDGFHDRVPGYVFPPSQLTLSSGLTQPQALEQPASASIPYLSQRISETHKAYTTHIPPRSYLRMQNPSAMSAQPDSSIDSYIHGMGDSGPFRVEHPHHSSANSQVSTIQFSPFASSPAYFPTSLDGLLEDSSPRQVSQTPYSMNADRNSYHPTNAPEFLKPNSIKTTPLGKRGDSYHVGPSDALLRGSNLIIDLENSIYDTANQFLSHDSGWSALAPIHETETVAHWLHSSPSGLAQSPDGVTEFDASVAQMPLTQDSMTTEAQAEPQHMFSGPGPLDLTSITHTSPDIRRGAQTTAQEKSLAASASPGIDKSIDDLSGQYSDIGGDLTVLTDDAPQSVESSSQTPLQGENSPETQMDFNYSESSLPTTDVGASLCLSREDLAVIGRAHKLQASNSKPMKAVSKSRTLTKASRALTVYPQSRDEDVGRRRACVLCKKDKKQVSNVKND